MITHWNELLNTDCLVVRLGGDYVYPIFRNASTSLIEDSERTLINEEIAQCESITVYLREPEARFVSGLNEYCWQHKLDVHETWQKVKDGKITNRHFAPQWFWLFHLHKYYKGKVNVKSWSEIKEVCTTYTRSPAGSEFDIIEDCVGVDRHLIKHIGHTIDLAYLVREYKDVLPKA
tara:strand:- start:2251 stop:2778 length:528 start_codon:yes stop_codon:yes gene_type:complete